MNRSTRRMFATFAAFVLAVVSFGSVHAQNASSMGSVNVPFAFESGSHHYAPGKYWVTRIGGSIIAFQGKGNSGLTMTRSETNRHTPSSNQFVFDKVGDAYFLRRIYRAGQETYAEVPQSKAEKQAMTLAVASNRTPVQNTEVDADQ